MNRPLPHRRLKIGQFSFAVTLHSDEAYRGTEFAELYTDYPNEAADQLVDFAIVLKHRRKWQHPWRREVEAYVNASLAVQHHDEDLCVPILESAMNWAIFRYISRYLVLHAGVMEHDGKAVVLAGPSGSGKSTLCAALMFRGWRLLSDEMALIRPSDGQLLPNPRPIPLKNESIALIADRDGEAFFSRLFHGTQKGTICYLRPNSNSIELAGNPAKPALVIFPTYEAQSPIQLEPMGRAHAFMHLTDGAANYFTMLDKGFETLARFADQSQHFTLTYSNLDSAIDTIEHLVSDSQRGGDAI